MLVKSIYYGGIIFLTQGSNRPLRSRYPFRKLVRNMQEMNKNCKKNVNISILFISFKCGQNIIAPNWNREVQLASECNSKIRAETRHRIWNYLDRTRAASENFPLHLCLNILHCNITACRFERGIRKNIKKVKGRIPYAHENGSPETITKDM